MPNIFIPSDGLEDWRKLLAQPDLHWKTGYSARATAYAWEAADGLPPEIVTLLRTHPEFANGLIELLAAFPEWKVPLPGGDRESQSDVFVLARCGEHTLSITIEGKVSETFGPTVGEWLVGASDGKHERLAFLCSVLGINQGNISLLRYQLLHRTVSAILERNRFGMDYAAMIVHSFSQSHEGFDDYKEFVMKLGGYGKRGALESVKLPDGRPLYLGWATGDPKFLSI